MYVLYIPRMCCNSYFFVRSVLWLCQVDILEYIHENEYVHADIKAANLMLGYRDPEKVRTMYSISPLGILQAHS